MTDPLQSWMASVTARAGTREALEQASEWLTDAMLREDAQAVAFGVQALLGWLDLDVRGEAAKRVERLVRDVNQWWQG